MTCALLAGLILIATAVWLAIYLAVGTSKAPWPAQLARLAENRRGNFQPSSWGSAPRTTFRYGESWVSVTVAAYGTSDSLPVLEISMTLPRVYPRLDVLPRHASHAHVELPPPLLEVLSGDPEFDQQFRTIARTPSDATASLSTGVRAAIEQLVRFPERSWAEVNCARTMLTIRKRWLSTRPTDLIEFTDIAVGLYDQLLITSSEGIEFVAPGDAVVIDGARCVVCGGTLETDIVSCVKCKTPYHRDCWEYAGACSTFGCGETRAVAPRIAQLSPQKEQPTENSDSGPPVESQP